MSSRRGLPLIVLLAAAAVVGGQSTVSADAEQATPTTTIVTVAGPTTTAAGTSTPVSTGTYANCEAALNSADDVDPCTELEQLAFANFGAGLSALYAGLADELGSWAPIADHDPQLNRFALMACQYIVADYSEIGWLELAANITDIDVVEHETLFDAAMSQLCPALGYTRQFEWDSYVPFSAPGDENGATTTALAGAPATTTPPPTTVAAATTLPPPPTTSATPSTTAPTSTNGVATIDVQGVPTALTCTDIVVISVLVNASATDEITESSVCGGADEQLFAQIVAADPQSFDSFVYSPNIGVFTGAEFSVETTAWVGFMACSFVESGDPYSEYDTFVRNVFATADLPQPTPADTQLAHDEAQRILCPFLVGG